MNRLKNSKKSIDEKIASEVVYYYGQPDLDAIGRNDIVIDFTLKHSKTDLTPYLNLNCSFLLISTIILTEEDVAELKFNSPFFGINGLPGFISQFGLGDH